jgi:alpha-N-arabinofuranosidase
VVGHADIVETQNGEWWMVLLGVRPYEGFNYNLGRETFLAPITWAEDGWPILENKNGLINVEERLPDLEPFYYPLQDPCDDFEAGELGLVWNTVHPPQKEFYSLTANPGYLRLYLQPEVIQEICNPAFVGRRQQHKEFQATTVLEFLPKTDNEEAGLVLLSDDRFNYVFVKELKVGKPLLSLYKTENGKRTLISSIEVVPEDKLYLTIRGCTTTYDFYFGTREGEYIALAKGLHASLLSSTVNEGFTGTYIGMYASSNKNKSTNYADFDWFRYTKNN